MTPMETAIYDLESFIRGDISGPSQLRGIFREAIREAYEDAAKIVEDWAKQSWPTNTDGEAESIAAAIRARSMEQIKQPSQQITPNKPDSSKDS
jgi:hypothetical protein